jgi:hypothetical protein
MVRHESHPFDFCFDELSAAAQGRLCLLVEVQSW